uniref:glycosyltransferase n=1 Tax=Pedobacter schmidteae TaxID=2201271 RepID=UPI000EAFFDD3|nr:glycosyltransferase [Pedobacter schmidteae]
MHIIGAVLKLDNVLFLDPVSKADVFKYIFASDMGASVLKDVETFKTVYSNKTFDYMACKKPIFIGIDGVSRDLVEKADAGVYVEPENPKDFADKVRYYMFNSEIIIRQMESGYKFAKENFDGKALANRYINYLKEFSDV